MKKIILTNLLLCVLVLPLSSATWSDEVWYTLSLRFANVSDHHTHIRVSRFELPGAKADDFDNKVPFVDVLKLSAEALSGVQCVDDTDSETAEFHKSGHEYLHNSVFVITASHRNKKMKVAFVVEPCMPITKINLGLIDFVPGEYWITPLLNAEGEVLKPSVPLNPLPQIAASDFSIINKLTKYCK